MENEIKEGYYLINGTQKLLYFNGNIWQKPEKDIRKNYGCYVSELTKQPKIKSLEKVNI